MRKFPIATILVMTFITTLIIPFPANAESEKVVLHIEGMV
jgi:hypothetical protein